MTTSSYQLSKEKAQQQYDIAYHLLTVTFPLIKDQKLLLGIIHNIFSSLEHSLDAILEYERQLQLVPNYAPNFNSKFTTFKLRSAHRHKIPSDLILFISEIQEILYLQQKSHTEFQRGNRYVICNKDFQLKTITPSDLKEYLNKNKQFLEVIERIITRKS